MPCLPLSHWQELGSAVWLEIPCDKNLFDVMQGKAARSAGIDEQQQSALWHR